MCCTVGDFRMQFRVTYNVNVSSLSCAVNQKVSTAVHQAASSVQRLASFSHRNPSCKYSWAE